MRRFFISSEQAARGTGEGFIDIAGSDVRHITGVLRMREGDKLVLTSADGRDFFTEIAETGPELVRVRVNEIIANTTEPRVDVTLIQGVPKGDKMELIIQKNTELGVSRIVPVLTEFTVVRLDDKERAKKQLRWQKISEEAAKQCGRGMIPEVRIPTGLEAALSALPEWTLKWFAYENERDIMLKQLLTGAGPDFSGSIAVLIGAEGGFSGAEAAMAEQYGFTAFSLGRRILRTETAGIAVLAAMRCFFED